MIRARSGSCFVCHQGALYWGVMKTARELEKEGLLACDSVSSSKQFQQSRLLRLWHVDWCPWIPARYVLALMTFLGFVNVYVLRVNLSMALVVMINDSSHNSSEEIQPHPVYNWNDAEQGWILAAFFYGYAMMQVPGGWLATRFGGKYVFGIGIVMTAVLTLLTPLAAQVSVWALVVLRVLEGMFEGVTFPAAHALWGKWAPYTERSQLTAFSYSGQYLGSVISFPLTAVLCKYGFDGGWPSVFYIFGSIGLLWFMFWLVLGFNSPASHPRISEKEKKYIENSIQDHIVEVVPTPWLQIFTSPAVWAITISYVCNNYGFYTLLTCLPTYFKDVLNLGTSDGIIENGLYSAIPYLVQLFVVLGSGVVADCMRAKCCSTQIVRKLFTCTSFVWIAVSLLLCGYFGNTRLLSVTFLALGAGFGGGLGMAGHGINHIDIAPRFAGVLMGITNTAGTIPGIVAPIIAKIIAQKPSSAPGSPDYIATYTEEWREVFIISAEVYVFGAIVYLILASGEKQWWADGVQRRRGEQSDVKDTKYKSVQYK